MKWTEDLKTQAGSHGDEHQQTERGSDKVVTKFNVIVHYTPNMLKKRDKFQES